MVMRDRMALTPSLKLRLRTRGQQPPAQELNVTKDLSREAGARIDKAKAIKVVVSVVMSVFCKLYTV